MMNMNRPLNSMLPVNMVGKDFREKGHGPGRDLTIEETMAARFYRRATLIGISILLILLIGGILLMLILN